MDPSRKEPFLVLTSQGVRVYSGICPHLLGPLREGKVQGDHITCPWHGYCFDLVSGACLTVPGFENQSEGQGSPAPLALQPLPFAVEGEEVLVEIEEEETP